MGKISLGANVEGNFVGRIVNGENNPGGSIREGGILTEGTEGRIEVGWETFF